MIAPKRLQAGKAAKVIFVGGFLGSGKTTALGALAKGMIQRGLKVGIITNDQTENLVDTAIVREMLGELGVPVEEVVKGCFCCKFDELIEAAERILAHCPDVIMGEPVGSCTDFVAAVANPIKIHYRDTFEFAPFSILCDPQRVRELLLAEGETLFPEEVRYLFQKQMEEADLILLNKIDLLTGEEIGSLLKAIGQRFPEQRVMGISARKGQGVDKWLKSLLSGRPGANRVLRELDYDRYATAEAVLGWLNAAVRLWALEPFDAEEFLVGLAAGLKDEFRRRNAEIGHLKFVLTSSGKIGWANVTQLGAGVSMGGGPLGRTSKATLIVNARVRIAPEDLENIVKTRIGEEVAMAGLQREILNLQCFSPAYPQPPYVMREAVPYET